MPHFCRTLLMGCLPLALLSGCAAGSYSSETGADSVAASTGAGTGAPAPPFTAPAAIAGSHDVALVTASTAAVSVVVGGNETVGVTFASSDGRPLSALAMSTAAGGLPAGWSAPAGFTCAEVTTGSGCVLTLVYAPAAVDSGMLTVNYVVVDDSGLARTNGSLSIPYAATPTNNVVAAASPAGEVDAVLGAATTTLVTFTTDDGNAATDLALTTDLAALPAGWSSAATGFSCAIVSSGSGCQLALAYAPTVALGGTLTLNYAYTDDAGHAKTGSLNVPYRTAAANAVIATASPSGQIVAVQKTGGQSVPVTFTTDDGKPASQVKITSDLSKLPAGWSSATSGFTCASVGSGNGCQLLLRYAPTALASGTLTLNYAYVDGSGAAQTGTLELPYAATTNDNVVGTASPAGQVGAVVAMAAQPVTVAFTTDDGRPATALHVTTNLGALPPGWTSTVDSLSCPGIDPDSPCVLSLAYAPTAAGSGTLSLAYGYLDNAGEAKTGTVAVAYRATTNDSIVGSPSPGMLAVRSGSSTPVTVTFATNDANPASLLSVTTDLTALPAGWSAAGAPFACATVSAGTACSLSLTYAPTAAAAGTLNIAYAYTNDAGFPGTGTVAITYSAITPYLYVADGTAADLSACPLGVDDSVGACITTAQGLATPAGLAQYGSFVYVTSTAGNSVSQCTVAGGGALSGCTAGGGFSSPTFIVVNPAGTFAYVGGSPGITACAIGNGSGILSNCTAVGTAFAPLAGLALSADGSHAYAAQGAAAIDVCSVGSDGSLAGCTPTGNGVSQADAVLAVRNGTLYASTTAGALYACPVDADASLGACVTTGLGTHATAMAFSGATAYLSTASAVLACPVNADGTLGACTTDADPTFNGTAGMVVR